MLEHIPDVYWGVLVGILTELLVGMAKKKITILHYCPRTLTTATA